MNRAHVAINFPQLSDFVSVPPRRIAQKLEMNERVIMMST